MYYRDAVSKLRRLDSMGGVEGVNSTSQRLQSFGRVRGSWGGNYTHVGVLCSSVGVFWNRDLHRLLKTHIGVTCVKFFAAYVDGLFLLVRVLCRIFGNLREKSYTYVKFCSHRLHLHRLHNIGCMISM